MKLSRKNRINVYAFLLTDSSYDLSTWFLKENQTVKKKKFPENIYQNLIFKIIIRINLLVIIVNFSRIYINTIVSY